MTNIESFDSTRIDLFLLKQWTIFNTQHNDIKLKQLKTMWIIRIEQMSNDYGNELKKV